MAIIDNLGGMGASEKEQLQAIYDIVSRNAGFELIEYSIPSKSGTNSFTLYKEEEYIIISFAYLSGDYAQTVSVTSDNENVQITEVLPQYHNNGAGNSFTHYMGLFKINGNIGDTINIVLGSLAVNSYRTTIARFHIIYS